MEMFCRILLLIGFISRVHGTSEPHGALRYSAEEGGNVTVEWSFSSGVNVSVSSLKIHCVSELNLKVFFHQDRSVDETLHRQFAGRVQCDQDALGTGRVRLRLSGVRTEDSGLYLCRMFTGSGRKVKPFSLYVSAVKKHNSVATKAAATTSRPAAESRVRVRGKGLYVALGLAAGALALALALALAASCCRPVSALRRKPERPTQAASAPEGQVLFGENNL